MWGDSCVVEADITTNGRNAIFGINPQDTIVDAEAGGEAEKAVRQISGIIIVDCQVAAL